MFTVCEESLPPCTCTRVRHFSARFNFYTWAPILVRFFLANKRGIVRFPKNARFDQSRYDLNFGNYYCRPKNQIAQTLTNGVETVVS